MGIKKTTEDYVDEYVKSLNSEIKILRAKLRKAEFCIAFYDGFDRPIDIDTIYKEVKKADDGK